MITDKKAVNKLGAFLTAKEELIDRLCELGVSERRAGISEPRKDAVALIIKHMKETEKMLEKTLKNK